AAIYNTVAADDVLVLGTPVEGIYLAARAILEPDDEVIVLNPAYDALINMFEHVVGVDNVKKWNFIPADGAWELNLDDLRGLISDKTKLVVVNFPHNPTGYLPSPQFQKELVAVIEEHNLWLFFDEMYFGLVHAGTETISSAADLTKRAVVLSGLSKTYGLPGLRAGWLIVQDPDLKANILNWKFYTSICPPNPTEFLAIGAIRVWEQLRDKNIAIVEKNKQVAADFFSRWPDLFTWRQPLAGSTALVGYNVESVTAVSEKLAQEAGILIHPGTTLGSDDQHMRIGLGRVAFAESLSRFEDWLKQSQ
ncbi:MAG: pyridoxal phosphate-dependent aminotransferase, partial [Chloroflexota bacterium]